MSEVEKYYKPAEMTSKTALAARIAGISNLQDVVEREVKQISVKLPKEIVEKIDEFAEKAGITRTAVIEILLSSGIEDVKEEVEHFEEMTEGETE